MKFHRNGMSKNSNSRKHCTRTPNVAWVHMVDHQVHSKILPVHDKIPGVYSRSRCPSMVETAQPVLELGKTQFSLVYHFFGDYLLSEEKKPTVPTGVSKIMYSSFCFNNITPFDNQLQELRSQTASYISPWPQLHSSDFYHRPANWHAPQIHTSKLERRHRQTRSNSANPLHRKCMSKNTQTPKSTVLEYL